MFQNQHYQDIDDGAEQATSCRNNPIVTLLGVVAAIATIVLLLLPLNYDADDEADATTTTTTLMMMMPLLQQTRDSSEIAMTELPVPEKRCKWVADAFRERDGPDDDKKLKDTYAKQSEDFNVFYRATAHIFWYDFVGKWGNYPRALLKDMEVQLPENTPLTEKSTWTWVTGDQHLSNFGAWRNRHKDVVFGVNDFDEAAIYDFHVDVLRIAVSICNHALANRFNDHDTHKILKTFTKSYVETVEGYVGNEDAMLFELTPQTTYGVLQDFLKKVETKKSTSKQLKKFTNFNTTSGERYFVTGGIGRADEKTKLASVPPDVEAKLKAAFSSDKYGATMMKLGWNVRQWDDTYFKVLDVAERVGSGVGSFGVDRYYVLLDGSDDLLDEDGDGQSVILDVKFEPIGAVERVLSDNDQAWYKNLFQNPADRVAEGQRRLTSYTDPFTGWVILEDDTGEYLPFAVRQRSPWKDSIELDELLDANDFKDFVAQIATATATSHVRGSPSKPPADFKTVIHSIMKGGNNRKEWGEGVENFAKAYHKQVLLDYECFLEFITAKYTNTTET